MGSVIDRTGRLEMASSDRPVALELGCGSAKRDPEAVGVDQSERSAADVVGDAYEVLSRLSDASVSRIYSEHFLEHVPDLIGLVHEASRVLVDGGEFRAVVPHFSNSYFYSDPTHRTPFGLYTFAYLAETEIFRRAIPRYDFDLPFRLVSVRLGFKATRPFYIRYGIRRAIGAVVNAHRAFQELYEDVLTGVVSCYEVDYRLVRQLRTGSA